MWRLPRVAILVALALSPALAPAQTVLFSENFGTPGATTALGTYTGYQNFGTLTFSGSGDIRGTTVSNYSGASGGGNVFLTNSGNPSFTLSGINTTGYQAGTLSLTFGAYKNSAASTMSTLSLGYSTDGTNFTPLSIPAQASGAGTANWRSITLTSTALPLAPNLSLRWTNTGTDSQFRLDDISMRGSMAAVPEPSTYAVMAGATVLLAAVWQRKRSRQTSLP